jgi:hypothetical protein
MKRLLLVLVLALAVLGLVAPRAVRAQITTVYPFLSGAFVYDSTGYLSFGPDQWDIAVPMQHDGVVDVFFYHKGTATQQGYGRMFRIGTTGLPQ